MSTKVGFAAALVCAGLLLMECRPKHKYEFLVAKELGSGIRHDSLFLGIKFGMTERDFFVHCWELNKQGVIRQGSGNISVLYELDELKAPADMNFYPSYIDNKISEMPVQFNYKAWAPWSRQLFADSLILDVRDLMEEWYGGNDFMEVQNKTGNMVFIKVDGNRRITLYKNDDQFVTALFTDLTLEEEIEQIRENSGETGEQRNG